MNLTREQSDAAQSWATITLVIAGAGSGKTRTLTERVRFLVDRGVRPDQILALTFTRKAAGELRSRLAAVLGDNSLQMSIGTVHSVCLRILETYGDRLGYDPTRLTVIDPDDREMLIDQVCRDLGFRRGKAWRAGLSGRKIERGLEAFEAGEFSNDRSRESEAVADIIREFHGRLFAMNMLDFGRILSETARLFKSHPDVLDTYRRLWVHVLVDEVQDSAQVEFSLYEMLCPPANLFMVGDFRQSIYGFRWARPDLISSFADRPGALSIDLKHTFRCGDVICAAANRLMANDSPMAGASGLAGAVEVMTGRSADIAGRVIRERSKLAKWSEIAVLARSNRELIRLERVFAETFPEVPVYRAGRKFDICDGDSFKDVHAMMRLAVNPRDELAFMRFASRVGLSTEDMARLRAAGGRDGSFAAYMQLRGRPGFADIGGEQVARVFAPEWHYRFGDPAVCEWWVRNAADMTVAAALDWYSLNHRKIDAQEDVAEIEAVRLMTVHAAKGLEFPVVILTGLNEGSLPSSQSIRANGVDEERRVCYVGMTRASHRLILHYRSEADQGEDRTIRPPSRFLQECGAMCMEAVA